MRIQLSRNAAAAVALLAAGLAWSTGVSEPAAQTIQVQENRDQSPAGVETHVAQPGDTLYDLSRAYLGDPYMWPQLWSYNPQITNPHWIYPGDIIFLGPPAPLPPPGEVAARAVEAQMEPGFHFPLGGFYTGSELETIGEIQYAFTGRRFLVPHDEVYLRFDDPAAVSVGDEFVVNRIVDRVYDEEDDEKLVAVKYIASGRVKVIQKHAETELITAEVTQIWNEIERGDALFINQPQFLVIEPRENDVDIEATIMDMLGSAALLHEQHYIFLDVGYEDGLRPGNRAVIWERRDEGMQIRAARTRRLDYHEDVEPDLPWRPVGEVMVLYATNGYSTAIITDAGPYEIFVGQRLTFRQGF